MTAYDFPPTAGEPTDGSFKYTAPTGVVYEWNGYSWTVSVIDVSKYVKKAGDTMTGALNVPANATGSEVPRVDEVVRIGGDVMTGSLYLNGDPVSSFEAATKSYVDNNSGGGGEGGTTINYNGASAWGFVNGTILQNGLNVNPVISNPLTGVFDVTFSTPMPDANYSVVATAGLEVAANACNCSVGSKTANGFQININKVSDNSPTNQSFQFTVFATNALPPKGTTGTDSFGSVEKTTVNGPCAVFASYNVASVSRISIGYYQVTFTTPMPTANYGVTTSPEVASPSNTAADYTTITTSEKTANGFKVLARFQDYDNGGTRDLDSAFNFAVNCTNANLPFTVTQEQIESAINSPGVSAWALTDQQGNLLNDLNFASVTRTGGGKYDYVFATPMPSADYSLVGNVTDATGSSTNGFINFNNLSATGFTVTTKDGGNSTTNRPHSLAVFATNAILPDSFTKEEIQSVVDLAKTLTQAQIAKAWGSINDGGTQADSYNIASVNNSATGVYEIVFITPMSSAFYSVSTAVTSNTYAVARPTNKTANGFTMRTLYSASGTPTPGAYGFDFQVFSN